MNNISTSVSENWNNTNNTNINNNHNPSLLSFVGLQANHYKQFLDWETNPYASNNGNTSTTNNHPFNLTNPTNIFDYTHLSSLPSSSFNANLNFIPPPQFSDYPSVDFMKKEVGGGLDGGDGFAVDDTSYYTGSSGRIGLNLGHRTYFSSRETALIDRLFRRPRGFYQANQVPRCQAEGCKIDLTNAKHYHRRHKVCEFHSKATKVVTGGIEQRFCQQCSRFHVLAEFDQAKRSCRKRLADHNRRRRKPQPGQSTTDSLPTPAAPQSSETANPQVGPSASISRSEHKETSLSSSATTSAASRSAKSSSSGTHFINGPDLSLGGGEHQHQHQRPFIYNQQSSSDLFNRDNTAAAAPYHNLFFSASNSNESPSLFDSDGNYV